MENLRAVAANARVRVLARGRAHTRLVTPDQVCGDIYRLAASDLETLVRDQVISLFPEVGNTDEDEDDEGEGWGGQGVA